MYYVYVLLGDKGSRLYIGRTIDLKKRLRDHRLGKCWTTRRFGNLKLIFYEAFRAKSDCVRRESYFKTNKGRSSLKQIIRESLI